jgi:hypothetical protein
LEWQEWQEYRPARDDFNRPFILSLVQFYHETDIWLFGGVFRVIARHPDRYEVELSKEGEGFLGRLKLRSTYRECATRVKFENHYPGLEVQEILREPYSGRSFPGFEDIDLSFEELEALVRNSRPDWQAAISSIKALYRISLWRSGDLVALVRLCRERPRRECGASRPRERSDAGILPQGIPFRAAGSSPRADPDELILAREAFWKRILLTRCEHGLNRN